MPYGSSTGVERLIGDIVASRDFTTTSVPTTAQIAAILDDVQADLDRELSINGFTVPVASSDTTATAYLASINNYGAAAITLGTIPTAAYIPGGVEIGETRAQMFEARFQRAIELIREKRLPASRSRRNHVWIRSGGASDSDNNTKVPLFKRGQDDYPSSRSLTE